MLIGEGKPAPGSAKFPKEVMEMADYIRASQAEKLPSAKPADEKPRKISAAEKRKTAQVFWNQMANRIQVAGLTERLWEHLDDEDLDSVSAALTTVAAEMKKALRARSK